MHSARHVITRISYPRFLNLMTFYDVASTMRQPLVTGVSRESCEAARDPGADRYNLWGSVDEWSSAGCNLLFMLWGFRLAVAHSRPIMTAMGMIKDGLGRAWRILLATSSHALCSPYVERQPGCIDKLAI
jgi:hypothetical protein